MKMKIFSCVTLTFLIAVPFLSGCKKAAPGEGIVTLVIGSVELSRSGEEPIQLKVKDSVRLNDSIITSAGSMAVIQFSNNCVVQIQENTRCTVLSLDANSRDLFVKEGMVLAKLIKMKDNNAVVRTPTAIAGVRGTQFSVNYQAGVTKVVVKEGAVAVTPAKHNEETGEVIASSKKETLAEAGQAAEVTEAKAVPAGETLALDVTLRPAKESEKQELKKIENINIIEDPQKIEDKELESIIRKQIGEDVANPEAKLKALLEKKTRTLEEIQGLFNRIDEVTLYNGRVIKGAILHRGPEYKILAPEGVVTVPEDQIKSTGVAK